MVTNAAAVRLEGWTEGDLALLRASNAPELMEHLGGPETEERLLARHRRYVALSADRTGPGRVYRVVADTGEDAGTVTYWETEEWGEPAYEIGWGVLPAFQGRGIATAAALAVIAEARARQSGRRYLHACPKVSNEASNRVCAKAGFALVGAFDTEYPEGNPIRANHWRFDLTDP
ncbi:hypothetical protein GCM10010387_54190 [Streptomyces inusitatus]|uniref:N-acetyltransferase domain-containing protein n=1 Tax=Streptomyces inusitatus TaxID=68221 RepID=A0A918QIR1_9ACTN|nr:GNAT family N-acetyltransferase [Streptomyces inusitatus]GGZ53176.1 hypothetical protein GCM10010387_54190 [Streptomyces inusitatus]